MPQKQTRKANKKDYTRKANKKDYKLFLRKLKKKDIKLLFKDTYLAVIKNSCGSIMWSNNYALVKGTKYDLVDNGDLSCAFFVSSILKMFDLISGLHITTKGLEKDLIKSGWHRITVSSYMPSGSVLIWESKGGYKHSGFYFGQKRAISIWTYHNFPIIHHWTYNNSRKIIRAYYHSRIKN